MPVLDVLAGCKLQHLRLAQFAILIILDALHRGIGNGETCIVYTASIFVHLPPIPFGIDKHSETVFKSKLSVSFGIGKLTLQFGRHTTEPHCF